MSLFPHVDEVVDDHTTQIAKAKLSRDFFRSCKVELIRRFFGGIVGAGTLLFAFGMGPCVAIGILLVKKYLG